MNCSKCNSELTDKNWYPSWKKKNIKICIPCECIRAKKYNETHKDELRTYHRERRQKNPEKYNLYGRNLYKLNRESILLKQKKRYENNKEELILKAREYRKTHKTESSNAVKKYQDKHVEKAYNDWKKWIKTPNGRDYIRKKRSRRRRTLGFSPLNSWFKDSNGHHINLIDVIYIPKDMNKEVFHNVKTGKNMEIINTMAYFFLLMQNIDKIRGLIK